MGSSSCRLEGICPVQYNTMAIKMNENECASHFRGSIIFICSHFLLCAPASKSIGHGITCPSFLDYFFPPSLSLFMFFLPSFLPFACFWFCGQGKGLKSPPEQKEQRRQRERKKNCPFIIHARRVIWPPN